MTADFTPLHGQGSDADRSDQVQQAYRTLYRLTPAMMHSVDTEGRIVAVSDEWLRVLGYGRDEVLGRPSSDFLTPESRAYLDAVGDREFTQEDGVRDIPYAFVAKDGRTVHVLLSAVGEVDADGDPVRTITILQDVTDQREAERVRDRFGAIMEATPDLVGIADRGRNIVYVNPAGARLLGRKPEELVGTSITGLHPPGEAERILDEIMSTALDRAYWVGESTIGSAEGEEIPVHMVALVHTGADGEPEFFSTIMRDLRARHRLEAQVRRSQKMEAMGRLAGGIVHDFNNVLSVTSGAAQMLLEELGEDHELAEEVREILGATDRAATLTEQLLAFGRGRLMNPEAVQTTTAIEEIAGFLRRMVGDEHSIELEVDADVWAVRADPAQLDQVIVNLGVNARDAMPDGGRIRISARNLPSEEVGEGLPHPEAGDRDWVELSVRDEGHGMSDEVKERIFEPFFTTKPPNRGTGLGLSTVYGIVRQSGGQVDVWSAPGEGTEFSVLLPRARADDETLKTPVTAEGEPGMGSGRPVAPPRSPSARAARVLVVEDDEPVRRVFARFLNREGYTVLESSEGRKALEILESGPVDVLVTDGEMPGMSGAELIQTVREREPGLAIILVSGRPASDVSCEANGGVEFLQKPVNLDDLHSCIVRLLTAGPDERGRDAPGDELSH